MPRVALSETTASPLQDAAGNVLTARPVYVYVTGTTTQVPVYAAATGQTLMQQPLLTGGTGNIPGYVSDEQTLDVYDPTSGATDTTEAISGSGTAGLTLVLLGSGRWFLPSYNVSTSAALGNTGCRVSAVFLSRAISIPNFCVEFTAAGDAASYFQPSLWADNGNGYPGALAAYGQTVSTGSGNAGQVLTGGTAGNYTSPVVNGPAQLAPGLYWIGGALQGVTTTQPTFRTGGFAPYAAGVSGAAAPAAGLSSVGYSIAVSAPPPSTYPVNAGNAGVTPRVGFYVS